MHSNNPQGIDVSASNGEFDWNAWQGHIQFAMAMATQGTDHVDPEFMYNWDNMSRLELTRFAFHWFVPGLDPASQAVHFYQTVKELGLTEFDGLVVYAGEEGPLKPVNYSFALYVFCRELEALSPNHAPIIYTYPDFADDGNCAMLGEYPLWTIEYDTPLPHVPVPWADWTFWQTSGSKIGRDVFNGNMKQLDNWLEER